MMGEETTTEHRVCPIIIITRVRSSGRMVRELNLGGPTVSGDSNLAPHSTFLSKQQSGPTTIHSDGR